jgi:tRNA-specific 2-thiouridylase
MNGKNVIVAMSGGVDSSVAAALMIQQGYNVTGIMLKLWTGDCENSDNACCTPEAVQQARQVAGILGIPFYVDDVKKEFKSTVVDKFVEMSGKGITPNPCFYCNQSIRWGELLDKTLSLGADYLVTGHYAIIEEDQDHVFHLKKGVDAKKDQSYILSGLNQKKLQKTIFPLGKFQKEEVRLIAMKYGFTVAQKPDSQDLCFVGSGGYREFLSHYSSSPIVKGNIRDSFGNIVGEHNGLAYYTIGQRKGLGSGFQSPVYVINKDVEKNEIVIGSIEALSFSSLTAGPFNWITGKKPVFEIEYDVKIRYKSIPKKVRLSDAKDGLIQITFNEPVRDATPGQVAVVYVEDEVIGSGLIQEVFREK